MSVKIEYKGKDVDEAINQACSNLNVSREELEIEVISPGSAGIFGLCRRKAVIQVAKKEIPVKNSAENNSRPGPAKEEGAEAAADHKPSSKKLGIRQSNADEAPAKSPGPEVIDEIKNVLENILNLMGYPSEVALSFKGNRVDANINSGDSQQNIIGREGSCIDAIQYLMRKIITHKFPEKIFFSLDAGNYRDTRKKELEKLAVEMAEKVKETGKSRTISALNPAERRIIHVTLQNDKTIRSASIGEGLFKKVRIYPPGQGGKKSSRRTKGGRKQKAENRRQKTD